MAKLVDALDLGSSGVTHQSSNLCTRTKILDNQFGDTKWNASVAKRSNWRAALDLGSSGVTHQSSNLCTPTKIPEFFNTLDNCVGMADLVQPGRI